MLRRTCAVVNLGKIAHNIRELKRAAGTDVMAVVKADAYGHGMEAVAKTAAKNGVHWMAVATPEEALALRRVLPDAGILILSPVEEEAYLPLIQQEISLCAFLPEQVKQIGRTARTANKTAKVHLKLDTGMGRVGLRTMEELDGVLDAFFQTPQVRMEGLFTHFATADEADKTFAMQQLAAFGAFRAKVLEAGFAPVCHASNSAATIEMPQAHFDLCRLGISMYGYLPSGQVLPGEVALRPALSLVSYISHIKTIHAGDTVSYGRIYTAPGDRRIATVPIGYADGYRRALSGKARAIVNGALTQQVGRVCMDQIMLDVTEVQADVGDTVTLLGEQGKVRVTADDLAEQCGTISYEILTGLSARVPRIYEND